MAVPGGGLGRGQVVDGQFENTEACEFTFTFEVTEGADDGEGFVVKVGDRGESLHSFEELRDNPDEVEFFL